MRSSVESVRILDGPISGPTLHRPWPRARTDGGSWPGNGSIFGLCSRVPSVRMSHALRLGISSVDSFAISDADIMEKDSPGIGPECSLSGARHPRSEDAREVG
jgi:hypothetical protein